MQKFLEWLDTHDLLDPLEDAISLVAAILFGIWCLGLAVAAIVIIVEVFVASPWWLLAYLPLLVLVVLTLTVFYYIDARK
jgi:quinol-cytochrome oxidoreductase complex cytochrome b subunit